MREQLEDMKKRIGQLESVGKMNELAKLEQQVTVTQMRLNSELRRKEEMEAQLERSNRRVRELALQTMESKHDYTWMEDLVDKLQTKLTEYQTQLDEAHEIAAENLKKYEATQRQLLETRRRAQDAEAMLKQYRKSSF